MGCSVTSHTTKGKVSVVMLTSEGSTYCGIHNLSLANQFIKLHHIPFKISLHQRHLQVAGKGVGEGKTERTEGEGEEGKDRGRERREGRKEDPRKERVG